MEPGMMTQIENKENDTERTAETRGKRQIRNTMILIVSLVSVFLVLYLIQRRSVPDSGLSAVIQVDGEKVHTMDLDRSAEYTVTTGNGHFNTVVVKDQSVSVREADCANQICVQTGQIRYPGEVIACLPHKLIIVIE